MKPFTRLRGNFKTAAGFDHVLGPLTLFCGANQHGKSSRIIAARYALRGVAGWTLGVHGSSIAELAPEGADSLFAELSGPAGSAAFTMQRKSDGTAWADPKRDAEYSAELAEAVGASRDRILPLAAMSDLLTLGKDRGRRAIVTRFGGGFIVPTPTALRPEQQEMWDDVLKVVRGEDAGEILSEMSKELNKRKLAASRRAGSLEREIQEQAAVMRVAGAEQIPLLQARLEKAKAWANAAHLRARAAQIEQDKITYRVTREQAQAQMEPPPLLGTLEEDYEAALAAVEQAQGELEERKGGLARGTAVLYAVERQAASGQSCRCPLCGAAEFDPAVVMRPLQESAKGAEVKLAEAERAYEEAQQRSAQSMAALAQAQERTKAYKAEIQQKSLWFTQEAARIQSAEAEVRQALEQLGAPELYDGPSVEELQAELIRLKEAEKQEALNETRTAEAREQRALSAVAKLLEGECKRLLDRTIKDVQQTAESTVNRYMPSGLVASLDLNANTWRVIDRNGIARNRHTMCGFEENALVPALAAAYTEGAPLRVLTLDDGDLKGVGTENVERFFGALVQAVQQGYLTQVLCAGNRLEHMAAKIQALGWHVIDVGNVEEMVL